MLFEVYVRINNLATNGGKKLSSSDGEISSGYFDKLLRERECKYDTKKENNNQQGEMKTKRDT
jgi:hypothetical protein